MCLSQSDILLLFALRKLAFRNFSTLTLPFILLWLHQQSTRIGRFLQRNQHWKVSFNGFVRQLVMFSKANRAAGALYFIWTHGHWSGKHCKRVHAWPVAAFAVNRAIVKLLLILWLDRKCNWPIPFMLQLFDLLGKFIQGAIFKLLPKSYLVASHQWTSTRPQLSFSSL